MADVSFNFVQPIGDGGASGSWTIPSSFSGTTYFLLVGPGGNMYDGFSSTYGGSGGGIYGSVNLPPNTVVYYSLSAPGNGNQGTAYISLNQDQSNGQYPDILGLPYVWGGDNANGGGGGAGGSWAWVGINNNVAPNPSLYGPSDDYNTYPVTLLGVTNGNAGDNYNPGSSVYPPSPFPGIPGNPGQGGNVENPAMSGLILLSYGTPIPWPPIVSDTVPCFPLGTRILTPKGYKAVESLEQGSLVTTAANKQVPVKIYNRTIEVATSNTAPYLIPKHSFGFSPVADLRLSPLHAFQIRKGVWQIPKYAALQNKEVKQYDMGKSVTYYHVECPNFFTDNLVVDGNAVESFGGNQIKGLKTLYKYNEGLKGFTRASQPSKSLTM
jgi:hypothetical protein